ncbi:MAG: aspartate/glutamate racemase family protein [Pseudomonadales bacterium]
MKGKRIGIFSIHPEAMRVAEEAFRQNWPEAELHHVLDDRLFHWIRSVGVVQPGMSEILKHHARYLVDSGADALLFTCSAFHECLGAFDGDLRVPVLGPNGAMIEEALKLGPRLALLATVPATLCSLAQEIRQSAPEGGSHATLHSYYVPDALGRLDAGDVREHNRLVIKAARHIEDVDAILLGQFTLAPVLRELQACLKLPTLSAPDAAVAKLRRMFDR